MSIDSTLDAIKKHSYFHYTAIVAIIYLNWSEFWFIFTIVLQKKNDAAINICIPVEFMVLNCDVRWLYRDEAYKNSLNSAKVIFHILVKVTSYIKSSFSQFIIE